MSEHKDLIDRLRRFKQAYIGTGLHIIAEDCGMAADEIERLEAELDTARKAYDREEKECQSLHVRLSTARDTIAQLRAGLGEVLSAFEDEMSHAVWVPKVGASIRDKRMCELLAMMVKQEGGE